MIFFFDIVTQMKLRSPIPKGFKSKIIIIEVGVDFIWSKRYLQSCQDPISIFRLYNSQEHVMFEGKIHSVSKTAEVLSFHFFNF